MKPEQLQQLDTFYMYGLKVIKSNSAINEGTTYEYSCPKSYYKDTMKETETGEKRTIKGLRTMFMEGHRTFRITKKREGVSTQFRNYTFTPIDKAESSLSY